MNNELLKQVVFDCAMELIYEQEELSNEEIGRRLLRAIAKNDSSMEDKIFHKAMEEATMVFGVDPAYFGKEGEEEVIRQFNKLGLPVRGMRDGDSD